jgi:radical SAM protein with 4Fe4S-binding SPASM domain
MRFRKLKSPTSVQWELTPNCNYKCIHCYNYWRTGGNVSGHIDYGIVTGQLIENKIFKVTLTGGEPLLVFSEIKPYIEKMVEADIKVSINTNAALLTQEMAEFFKANNIGLLISLPCCVPEINDKITTVKGSFDSTVAGIKLARENNVPVSVNMVVSKLNKDHVVDTAMFLHDELGLSSINVTKASRPINGSSEFDDYVLNLQEFRKVLNDLIFIKKEYSMFVDSLTVYPECACDTSETFNLFTKRKCFAGKTSLAIGYNGDVKACARDSVAFGNLHVKSLQECWESMDDLRIIDDKKLPQECQECSAKYSCLGGCRIDRNNEIPNKCYRDKTNLPLKFAPESQKCFDYLLTDTFEVISGLVFLEEEFGMRGINSKKYAFFVTRELYSFMIQHHTFSKEDLMKYFKISSEDANDSLSYLIENEAIKTF